MRRITVLTALIATVAALGPSHARVEALQSPAAPVTYVCPMADHADVLEDKPGKCPHCGMVLVPVIIDLAWSCPVHPVVITDRAGRCPLDKRDLVQVAISRYWTCPDKPNEHLTSAGRCADGAARTMVREHRAHGDHNPKHGGQLFMAPDNWHHIEATYPRPGLLRVFVYDNFSQPMSVRQFSGRAVTREEFDAGSGKARDLEAFPLERARDGRSFDARIGNRALPTRVTVKLRLAKDGPEDRFDFTFDAFSKEPLSAPPVTRTPPVVSPATASTAPAVPRGAGVPPAVAGGPDAGTPSGSRESGSVPSGADGASAAAPQTTTTTRAAMEGIPTPFDPLQLATPLPSNPAELLALLALREKEVATLLKEGQFGVVYVPALQAKDVALALEAQLSGLSSRRRLEAATAIKLIVVKAWELDAYGDLGDARKLAQAHAGFAAAVKDLQNAYASQ